MTREIYPCLWFDGNAKQAAEFYCSLFNNARITTETPMVVLFELHGKDFMGLNGGPHYMFTPAISFFPNCESVQETDAMWSALIDGGKALMPIGKYPWSERYGWVQDKFGLTWQIMLCPTVEGKRKIMPSLLFTKNQFGRAEEATKFYSTVFAHSTTGTIERYPATDKHAGKVMYSEFTIGEQTMIAMDGPDVHDYTFNEAVSFVVSCDTQDEIDYYWQKLTADGGQESMCGWLKDKFGVSWQVVPSILGRLMDDPEKGQRVVQAFLKMKKFDIQALLDA